jgi:CubicO group peptidase (beta-lactamase class C family)
MLTRRALLFPVLVAGVAVCGPAGVAAIARAIQTPGSSTTSDLAARVAAVDSALDERRIKYNVPGAALVIVLDDRVIELKGFGLRDVKQQLAVTPDTLFEIGSTTKAFTAMAAVITVDEGKFTLDDPVRKYLPYFKLRDPDADAKVTVRDLLTHRIGAQGPRRRRVGRPSGTQPRRCHQDHDGREADGEVSRDVSVQQRDVRRGG